jgi:hypothetical protein
MVRVNFDLKGEAQMKMSRKVILSLALFVVLLSVGSALALSLAPERPPVPCDDSGCGEE